MSAHTPGPWHWDSDPLKNDELGRVRYRVVALGRTITQTYYSSAVSGEPQTAEADTRLIAAAPDLLAALQMARALMVAIDGYTETGPSISVIDAAIAKATGSES